MSEAAASREQPDAIAFFAAITAGLSHELKNVLATVNELSGLQQDLLLMARRGRPLDEQRLEVLAGKISAQVQRGEQQLDALNRFAHSADHPLARVDLGELFALSMTLCQRAARLRRVELAIRADEGAGQATLSPFAFHRLIIWSLGDLLEVAGQGARLEVALERGEGAARVVMQGAMEGAPATLRPRLAQAARGAGARLELEAAAGRRRLVIWLPEGPGRQAAVAEQAQESESNRCQRER